MPEKENISIIAGETNLTGHYIIAHTYITPKPSPAAKFQAKRRAKSWLAAANSC
jgi:hypothetical protein